MAVVLEIDKGVPNWWLSPDLWVVPGNDPNGPPGTPVAGQPAFMWARVHNVGSDGVQNAVVRFWWANPGTNFDRTTATQVGTSYVSLAAGETQEALCLTPWTPSFVNGGHECILGEAFENTLDPLPPGPNFNAATDRHVAQRNLSVLLSSGKRRMTLPFEVHNDQRQPATFTVALKAAEIESLDRRLIATLGEDVTQHLGKGTVHRLGLARTVCPDDDDIGDHVQQVELSGGERAGFTAVVESSGTAFVHITQTIDDKVVGGLSVVAINQPTAEQAGGEQA